jgi:hypothetical protein
MTQPMSRFTIPIAPGFAFHAISLGVAAVAAVATFGTARAMLLPPAMFLGWIAYGLGGSVRAGFGNLGSFILGLGFGMGTAITIGLLTPSLGTLATPAAVAGVVVVVLSLRRFAPFDSPPAYFLGLTSFFYSGLAPGGTSFTMLAAAGAIGAAAAAIAGQVEGWLGRSAQAGVPA